MPSDTPAAETTAGKLADEIEKLVAKVGQCYRKCGDGWDTFVARDQLFNKLLSESHNIVNHLRKAENAEALQKESKGIIKALQNDLRHEREKSEAERAHSADLHRMLCEARGSG